MTDQPKRHVTDLDSERVWLALLQLLVEQGYIDKAGYLTPLGEAYVSAIEADLSVTTTGCEPPIAPPPITDASGGMSWSDPSIADF